jgi:hypothetical protein
MLLLKELMPSWMNYAHLYSGKEFLEGIEKRVTTDGISSLKISLIMYLGII